jgi:HlyD family secretion protein
MNRGRWIGAGVAVIVLAIAVALLLNRPQSGAATTISTTTVARGNIVATVSGSGTVAAAQTLDLPFQTSGKVTDVFVSEGDTVDAGQALARLDTRDLQLQVDIAQSQLDSAKAQLAQAQQGNATAQDIAAAEANVANASANLQKTRTGNITTADLAEAEADVRSAQAQLDALKNPSASDISAAELKVTQAQVNVQTTRDGSSAQKTNAELALQKAADALVSAQAGYAQAKSDWDFVQDTGQNPSNPETTNAQGETEKNDVNNSQREQYYAAFIQAEAAMRQAETAVIEAQVTFDEARQDEVVNIQQAEAEFADAQRQLEALRNPDQYAIAQQQASLDRAKAGLQKLRQGGTSADIAASQAQVAEAQANLEKLTAPQTETDLAIQQAAVRQAELDLEQAKLNLENATLTAPFAGIVTQVDIVPGSIVSSGAATGAISMMDRSTMYIDMTLSENDMAKIQVSQPVTLTIDALPDWQAAGEVTYIAPAATTSNDVVTYQARVSFPDTDERVKAGMTANADIVIATKNDVLFVSSSALLPKGSGQVVQLPGASANQPATEIDVQTGLTDGTNTEIISGLNEGDVVIATPREQEQQGGGGLFGR